MFPAFGVTELMWLVGGWFAKEQLGDILDAKKKVQGQGQGPNQGQRLPQAPQPAQLAEGGWSRTREETQAQVVTGGPWAPGMPQGMPQEQAVARKPLGPVALDLHIELPTEQGVWQCLQEGNEKAARTFAIALAQSGLPVAASIVSYHAFQLGQLRKASEKVASDAPLAGTPVYDAPPAGTEASPPQEMLPRSKRRKEPEALPEPNGVPVVAPGEQVPAPFVPRAPAG
jgi:hypothetical protein